jgi:signal transduction histidine kinase
LDGAAEEGRAAPGPFGKLGRAFAEVFRSRPSPSIVTLIVGASVLLAAGVMAAFTALVLTISSLRESTDRASQSKDVTAAALDYEKGVLDLESSLRGFVITGNNRFLGRWSEARREIPPAGARLRELTEGDPDQRARAATLQGLVTSYVEDYASPLLGIARESPAAARASVATAEGKRRLDQIRRRFSRFLAVEDSVSAEQVSSAGKKSTRAVVIGVSALAASALLILAFGVYLARRIARPVRDAAEGASRVAAGDLSTRLPETGPGEVHELAHAFNTMAESLQRNQRELERQNRQLRESERLKSELVSIVSHELRTPLASVIGYAQVLLSRPLDEETRQRYLEVVAEQARRLAGIVEDFLDVRRIEAGRLELREQPFDLARVLRDQVRMFAAESELHPLHLAVPEAEELGVRGDPDRLAQVVGNLLANAIKYSPEGGAVRIAGEVENGLVRVTVRDEGIGIAREHQPRIFTKFFRGGARESGIAGAGLGLALSREIVEAHGGRIGFESSVDEGSVFWFELPLLDPAAGSAEETPSSDVAGDVSVEPEPAVVAEQQQHEAGSGRVGHR